MWLQRERKDDVIWSDLKLGGHLELNAILFQSWSKLRSRSKLTSFIGSNISRSSSHTTLWFLQVKHRHLKTNLQGLLSHLHILIFSKSNLKLQVFGLFSCFVRTLIIKISSSEGPANTTSIHRVRNIGILVIFCHPSPESIIKKCRSPSWKPAEAHWKNQNGAERAEQNSSGACAAKCPSGGSLCLVKLGETRLQAPRNVYAIRHVAQTSANKQALSPPQATDKRSFTFVVFLTYAN